MLVLNSDESPWRRWFHNSIKLAIISSIIGFSFLSPWAGILVEGSLATITVNDSSLIEAIPSDSPPLTLPLLIKLMTALLSLPPGNL